MELFGGFWSGDGDGVDGCVLFFPSYFTFHFLYVMQINLFCSLFLSLSLSLSLIHSFLSPLFLSSSLLSHSSCASVLSHINITYSHITIGTFV